MLKLADRVFGPCFPAENHTWQAMAGKSRSAKEYTNAWLDIHYLDFDSIAPYYV